MKIDKIQALRGPNIWSVQRKKLIQMRLDLEDLEERPTNKIEGFRERIEAMFPTMIEHRCSEGCRGGFFSRVERGTWMGHVIEHIALEIQTLAGMETGFGRTRETKTPGIYNVVFSYTEESVGLYAAEASVRIAEALIAGTEYDPEVDIQKMREIRERVRLGPSTGSIVEEAVARDIPWIRLGTNSLVQLGYGVNQMRRTGRSWILINSVPLASSITRVWRTRSALPSTLNARRPDPSSIQKSSPIDSIFSRIWKRAAPPRAPNVWRSARRSSPRSRRRMPNSLSSWRTVGCALVGWAPVRASTVKPRCCQGCATSPAAGSSSVPEGGCSTSSRDRRPSGQAASGDESEGAGTADRVPPVADVELAVDALEVGLDGVDRDVGLGGDLAVALHGRQLSQDGELAGGQRLDQRLGLRGRGPDPGEAGQPGHRDVATSCHPLGDHSRLPQPGPADTTVSRLVLAPSKRWRSSGRAMVPVEVTGTGDDTSGS